MERNNKERQLDLEEEEEEEEEDLVSKIKIFWCANPGKKSLVNVVTVSDATRRAAGREFQTTSCSGYCNACEMNYCDQETDEMKQEEIEPGDNEV